MWMSHPGIPGKVATVSDRAFYEVWAPKGWVQSVEPAGEHGPDLGRYISQGELDQALAGVVAGTVANDSVAPAKLAPSLRAQINGAVPRPALPPPGPRLPRIETDLSVTYVDPADLEGAPIPAPDPVTGYSPVLCADGVVRALRLYEYGGGGGGGGNGGGGDGAGWQALVVEDWTPGTMPGAGTTSPWPNAISGGNPITVSTGHVQAGGYYYTDNGGMRGVLRAPVEIEPTTNVVMAFAAKMRDPRLDNGPDRQWLVSLMAGAGDNFYQLACSLVHNGDGSWSWGVTKGGTSSSGLVAPVTQQTAAAMNAGLPQALDNPIVEPGWIGDLTVGFICRPAGGATPSQFYVNGSPVIDVDLSGLAVATAIDLNPLNEFGNSRGNKAVRRVAVLSGGNDAQAQAFLAGVQAS